MLLGKRLTFTLILCIQPLSVLSFLIRLKWGTDTRAQVLQDWLERRFKEIGYEKILNREYALEDLKTKRQIDLSREWQTQLYPGMYLGMDMLYKRQEDKFNTCPGCQQECLGAIDQTVEW
jgi:hypothetical protein